MYHRLAILGSSTDTKNHILRYLSTNESKAIIVDNANTCKGNPVWHTEHKNLVKIYNFDWSPAFTPSTIYISEKKNTVLIVHDISKEIHESTEIIRTALRYHYKNDIHFVAVNLNFNLTVNGPEISNSFEKYKSHVISIINEEIDTSERSVCNDKTHDKTHDKIDFLRRMGISVKSRCWLISDSAKELQSFLKSADEGNWTKRSQISKFEKCFEDLIEKTLCHKEEVQNALKTRKRSSYNYIRGIITGILNRTEKDNYECLKSAGSISEIDNYVVTNIEKMLKILYNISEGKYFKENDNVYLKHDEIQRAKELLKNGIVCKKILELWFKCIEKTEHINMEFEGMLEILHYSHMCYKFKEEDSIYGRFFYFPCFVQEINDISDLVNVKQPMKVDSINMSLQFISTFRCHIPLHLYEELCARFHSCTLTTINNWKCKPWKDGIFVSTGDTEYIVLRNKEESSESISLCIRGRTDTVLGQMWGKFITITESFMEKLQEYDALISDRVFVSPHCILNNIDPPYHWEIRGVLKGTESTIETSCGCDKEDIIPQGGFVTNLAREERNKDKQIEAVKNYLKMECDFAGECYTNMNNTGTSSYKGYNRHRAEQPIQQGGINININIKDVKNVHLGPQNIMCVEERPGLRNSQPTTWNDQIVGTNAPQLTCPNVTDKCLQEDIVTDNSTGSNVSQNVRYTQQQGNYSIFQQTLPNEQQLSTTVEPRNTQASVPNIFQKFANGPIEENDK